jgi:superfamily I DNA/RNA helicase
LELVYLVGKKGYLRNKKSFEDKSGRVLEEERGLAYVGITTAKEKLINSNADRKEMYNQCQSVYI